MDDVATLADDDLEPVRVLIHRAADGDQAAWEEIVRRYARLIISVTRSFRFEPEEVRDVSQVVWLRLVEKLGTLREPDAIAGWIAVTTRNECIRRQRLRRRPAVEHRLLDLSERERSPEDSTIDSLERTHVRTCFHQLDERCQQLLALLTADVEGGYAAISELISAPIGSIGPTRARCLSRLRQLFEAAATETRS